MTYDEIKRGISRFQRLVAEKKYAEADELAAELKRGGMTAHDFQTRTTKRERAAMRRWKKRNA